MTSRPLLPPLTREEVQSLAWIAAVATRVVVPVSHIEKLLDAGYIHEGPSGPTLTVLGELRLEQEREKLNSHQPSELEGAHGEAAARGQVGSR